MCAQINEHGNVLLDTFVAPTCKVTDFRTEVSGIRARDLRGAPPRSQVLKLVRELVGNRILVGHALCHDICSWVRCANVYT